MNFNGTEGSLIEMSEGAGMTAAYREAQPGQNLCVFFGKDLLNVLLSQNDAQGLRFYFAHNADGKMTLVTVAANSEGQDIQAKVGNRGTHCPDFCCTDSPLGNATE
ncbi:hypothetical protein EJV47_25640 [Hymenobacter gummosus]|uniref:Uncharacterized protein n=1 Tax=Hymenobacter gummosus TaxID=1776032 RepID=A0A3S0JAB6_9BACT|nr:hypothetical protein [Hymenobacter gummosus]RTQ45264.1 hypothetical protein EJV47_25640 [Hymenobacter gummosus]